MKPEVPKFRQFEEAFKEAIKEKKTEEGESTENPETAEEVIKDLKEMGITKTEEEKKEKKILAEKIGRVIDELNQLTDEFEGLNERDPGFLTEEEKKKFLETNDEWASIAESSEDQFSEATLEELKGIKNELKGILGGAHKRHSKISTPEPERKEVKSLKSQIEEGWDWLSRKKKLEKKRKSFKKPNI